MKTTENNYKTFLQPAFLACIAVLGIAGASMSFAVSKLGVYLKKEPIELKKSLDLLDESNLGPYKIEYQNKFKIENPEIVEKLGTRDYIQWIVEYTEAPVDSPTRYCLLFITYYDCPDRIPHVPEECYVGGGFQRMASDNLRLNVDNGAEYKIELPAKYLVFGSSRANLWLSNEKFPVIYFFRVNEEYAGNREDARIILNKNLFRKSSYFSKVELAFNQATVAPSKTEIIIATEKLLSVILPVLESQHWPDLCN